MPSSESSRRPSSSVLAVVTIVTSNTTNLINFVEVDFGEDQLLAQADREIAAPVKLG